MGKPLDNGCMLASIFLFLVMLPFVIVTKLLDTYKIDSCALVLIGGFASYAALAYGGWQVLA